MRFHCMVEPLLKPPDCAFDRIEIRQHRAFDFREAFFACGRDRIDAARSFGRMIPGRGHEAALFQPAQQRIDLVRVYGDEIAATASMRCISPYP